MHRCNVSRFCCNLLSSTSTGWRAIALDADRHRIASAIAFGQMHATAMGMELGLALGIPIAYLLISTAILRRREITLPRALRRLTSRDALVWNAMVAIMIAAGLLRWALAR